MYCFVIWALVIFALAHICAFRGRRITRSNLHLMEKMKVVGGGEF